MVNADKKMLSEKLYLIDYNNLCGSEKMSLTVTLKLNTTNCLCPPDSYVEILTPYVIIFEQEVFGR